MKITIFAAGSRGDVQPCAVFGRGLLQAGFEVQLVAGSNFSALAQEYGLDFYPLRGDIQSIMASDAAQEFMETGGSNPLAAIRAVRTMLGPVAGQMAEDLFLASENADALISLAIFAPFAVSVATLRDIPLILAEPTPMLPTGAFPAAGWPIQRNLGSLHNRLSGYVVLQFIWQWYRPFVNEFRELHGLSHFSGSVFPRLLSTLPLLGAYSPHVIPRPSDWPDSAHVTGYWLPEVEAEWEPPTELQDFLEAGEPPVCVGFSSMAGQNPERLGALVLEALERTGQRGLLLTGWGGIRPSSSTHRAFVLDYAPHSWLFQHVSAVVHHGGAGTTAEGLRAGVPAVIVPFIVDQPFWGMRVHALGVGPQPIPHKRLTVERLVRAIQAAVGNPEFRRRAQALRARISLEDGVGQAVQITRDILVKTTFGRR